jgi:putative transposase
MTMKLTLQIKMLPAKGQGLPLPETIRKAKAACYYISDLAFDSKTFRSYDLHHQCYGTVKDTFSLSAQVVVRCLGKGADCYKSGKKDKKRIFRPPGSIAYDSRVVYIFESV